MAQYLKFIYCLFWKIFFQFSTSQLWVTEIAESKLSGKRKDYIKENKEQTFLTHRCTLGHTVPPTCKPLDRIKLLQPNEDKTSLITSQF